MLSVKLYAYGELFGTYNHTVWATINEDVNLDCCVGIDDILAAASAFGSAPGDLKWNSHYDINDDYYVGIDYIFQIATKFGWDP